MLWWLTDEFETHQVLWYFSRLSLSLSNFPLSFSPFVPPPKALAVGRGGFLINML